MKIMSETLLYDYWRSSAAYRVRIALNLKKIAYRAISIDLGQGDQSSDYYKAKNPQALVPMLSIDGVDLTQSMAIIDYLDSRDGRNSFYPADPVDRAQTLANAMLIAADIHPLNNLRILKYLRADLDQDDDGVAKWYHRWIIDGFTALELRAPETGFFGGAAPNAADICLIPQIYNARRFDTPLEAFPKLLRIDADCNSLKAFSDAIPENVKPK